LRAIQVDEIMYSDIFPFKHQLLSHFAELRQNGKCTRNARHLNYYKNSIKRYSESAKANPDRRGKSLKEIKWPCQIERDGRFWIARSLMTIFYSPNGLRELIRIFRGYESTYI